MVIKTNTQDAKDIEELKELLGEDLAEQVLSKIMDVEDEEPEVSPKMENAIVGVEISVTPGGLACHAYSNKELTKNLKCEKWAAETLSKFSKMAVERGQELTKVLVENGCAIEIAKDSIPDLMKGFFEYMKNHGSKKED